jgi:hypothetical protein
MSGWEEQITIRQSSENPKQREPGEAGGTTTMLALAALTQQQASSPQLFVTETDSQGR